MFFNHQGCIRIRQPHAGARRVLIIFLKHVANLNHVVAGEWKTYNWSDRQGELTWRISSSESDVWCCYDMKNVATAT